MTPKMSVNPTAIRNSQAAYIAPSMRKPRKPDMMLSEQAASDLQRTRKGSATVLHELRRYWVFSLF